MPITNMQTTGTLMRNVCSSRRQAPLWAKILPSNYSLCATNGQNNSTWWITKNAVGIHRKFRISRATSMQEEIGQLVLITFVPIWDRQAEKPSFRRELMRVPSGGELIFARLEISSSLIYPGGNRGSLSSIIVLRSFSKVTPFSLVYAHPHSSAKLSISVRKEASWRGPVQSGPTTAIKSSSCKKGLLYTSIIPLPSTQSGLAKKWYSFLHGIGIQFST